MTQEQGIWETLASYFVPIHREGHKFVAIGALASLLFLWLWSPLGWLFAFATFFVAYFFRDPDRVVLLQDGLILSPADGTIRAIEKKVPPAELQLGTEQLTCISISLSLFDVHINRAPLAGKVVRSIYTPGLFLNADLDKASTDNERWSWVFENRSESTSQVGVVQIAGVVGRRIVSFISENSHIGAGERFGMIRFGSRVDVYLPAGLNPLTAVGQRVVAGETVLSDTAHDILEREARII